jgi:hypothetical protein
VRLLLELKESAIEAHMDNCTDRGLVAFSAWPAT